MTRIIKPENPVQEQAQSPGINLPETFELNQEDQKESIEENQDAVDEKMPDGGED